jgi:integrase
MDSTSSTSLTLRQLVTLYLDHAKKFYRRRSGQQTREAANMSAVLTRWMGYASEASDPSKINRHQVKAWLDQLAAEQLSRIYVNQCLSRLRRFVRWAVDLDYIPLRVTEELRLVRPLAPLRSSAKEPKQHTELSPDHIAQISAHLPRWARDVIQLLTLTGARPGELLELTNAEVHLDSKPRLTPLQHKTAHRGRHRIVPLSPAAIVIIERWHRPFLPADRLIYSDRSVELSTQSLTTAWIRARRKAGLPSAELYDIRRTVARKVRRTKGLEAAQALLGHAHASTTEIYAPVDPEDLQTFQTAQRATEGL